jgi:hypothetical protein
MHIRCGLDGIDIGQWNVSSSYTANDFFSLTYELFQVVVT